MTLGDNPNGAINSTDAVVYRCGMQWYQQGQIDRAVKVMNDLMDCHDPRVARKAAEFIQNHVWRCFEHANPPVQRASLTVDFPQSIRVEFVDAGRDGQPIPGVGSRQGGGEGGGQETGTGTA